VILIIFFSDLNQEQIDELIGFHKTAHQTWFLYKKAHKHYKLIKCAARLTSGAGCVLTIMPLGASLLIEVLLDYKNVNENMNNCKYAYLCCEHQMNEIKTAFRLGTYNSQSLIYSMAKVDDKVIDFCPQVENTKNIILKKDEMRYQNVLLLI